MTPEMMFATALGSLPTKKEKLAARMEDLSLEELEEVLRGKEKLAFGGLAKPPMPTMPMARPMARSGATTPGLRSMSPQVTSPTSIPSTMPSLMKGASVKKKLALAGPPMGAQLVGKAIKGVMRAPQWAGAAGGAALGAGRYMASSDPNKSFVGSVAGGAALGAGAQMGARTAIPAVMRQRGAGMAGQAGGYLRSANRAAAMPRPAVPAAAPAVAARPAAPAPAPVAAPAPVPVAPAVPGAAPVPGTAGAPATALPGRNVTTGRGGDYVAARKQQVLQSLGTAAPRPLPGAAPASAAQGSRNVLGARRPATVTRAMGDTSPGVENVLRGRAAGATTTVPVTGRPPPAVEPSGAFVPGKGGQLQVNERLGRGAGKTREQIEASKAESQKRRAAGKKQRKAPNVQSEFAS